MLSNQSVGSFSEKSNRMDCRLHAVEGHLSQITYHLQNKNGPPMHIFVTIQPTYLAETEIPEADLEYACRSA